MMVLGQLPTHGDAHENQAGKNLLRNPLGA
ncbi:hypothetical protein SBA2_250020 [Acidobacteriia bacterium SbA2]|nr:hypothetical protein SBA2_250020 [Acidobacteriia bacterium SbA2]